MSVFKVIKPPPPFEWGSFVEWSTDDGKLLGGSIVGFDVDRETATVEIGDGRDFEVPLASLRIAG